MDEMPKNSGGASKTDGKYFAVVGALLVMICAALAVLWILERRGRLRAESDAVQLRRDLQIAAALAARGSMMSGMGAMGGAGHGARLRAVQREELATQLVEYSGQPKQVLVLPAGTGRRLGFQVGDVIVVSAAVTTAPSSRPAGGPDKTDSRTPSSNPS